jgi:hypothetical protein
MLNRNGRHLLLFEFHERFIENGMPMDLNPMSPTCIRSLGFESF